MQMERHLLAFGESPLTALGLLLQPFLILNTIVQCILGWFLPSVSPGLRLCLTRKLAKAQEAILGTDCKSILEPHAELMKHKVCQHICLQRQPDSKPNGNLSLYL